MKYKVADLEGALLDAAVAKAEGLCFELRWIHGVLRCLVEGDFYEPASATSSLSGWVDGGPIIDREQITVSYDDQGGRERGMWNAYVHDCETMCQSFTSPLIAAMRAYVASKFGEEVELPA